MVEKQYIHLEVMKIQKKYSLDAVNIIVFKKINGTLTMMYNCMLQEARVAAAYLKIISYLFSEVITKKLELLVQ